MMRTLRSVLVSSKGHTADQKHFWRACKGVQTLAPPGSWKKICEEEVHSLSIYLSTHLSHTIKTSTLLRIKREREIFIKKCVRSFVHWSSQIMFDYVSAYICIWLYNTWTRHLSTCDGEVPILELRGKWSTLSLPLLPASFWSRVIVSATVPPIGQIELFNHLLYLKPFNCVQTNKLNWTISIT